MTKRKLRNPLASSEHYLELTALLIDREVAKFTQGEQAALVSFSRVAMKKLRRCPASSNFSSASPISRYTSSTPVRTGSSQANCSPLRGSSA
jgi:hypothetical protein